MRKLVFLLLISCSFIINAGNFKGPFRAEAMAFYLVHKGGPLEVTVTITADKEKKGRITGRFFKTNEEKVVCRFFNVNEELVKWNYSKIISGKHVSYKYNYGKNAPAGIYQVRYSGENIVVDLKSTPNLSFGILAQRCMLKSTSVDQFAKAYFYILPNTQSFSVRGYGIKKMKGQIFDAAGKRVAIVAPKPQKINVKGNGGQIWSAMLKIRPGHYSRFGVSGMPMILCPDKATARAIAGSVEKTSDGKYFAHKFQVKMYEWMKSLKKEDLELDIVDFRKDKKGLEADPYAGVLFAYRGLLEYLPYVLRFQDINPESKSFGRCNDPTALALAYSLKKPWNTYYHNKALEKRLLIPQFQGLLKLKENDSNVENDSNYSGADALNFMRFLSTSFCFAGSHIQDKKLAKLWDNAIRRVPDRFSMFRVSCENQSSHWPVAYSYMAKGSGEQGYKKLASDYIKGLSLPKNNKFMRTGYQQEAYGPDATYQGLGACYQALYYRMSGDKNAKKGLEIIYNLFNHTVAPEPDGRTVFGASNFSHRTAGTWTRPQYTGGRQFMKGELESAAVWYRNAKDFDYKKYLAKALDRPSVILQKNRRNDSSCKYLTHIIGSFYSGYLYPSKILRGAKFPVEKSDNFTKNFNNEFICVRRPAYYAMAYTGKTAAKWTKIRTKFNPLNKKKVYKWNQTQGLGMMWTPQFGNCVLGVNWNADTAQMVRADISDTQCDFPNYWSLKSNFDAQTNCLVMTWDMLKLPVSIKRKIVFDDDSVAVNFQLYFKDTCKVKGMYEQIPFLKKTGLRITFKTVDGNWQETPCNTNEVKFSNANNAGILFIFKKSHDFIFSSESKGYWNRNQIMQALKIKLGKEFKKGSLVQVQYKMIPFAK